MCCFLGNFFFTFLHLKIKNVKKLKMHDFLFLYFEKKCKMHDFEFNKVYFFIIIKVINNIVNNIIKYLFYNKICYFIVLKYFINILLKNGVKPYTTPFPKMLKNVISQIYKFYL
jgi:hypothetical protein